jgi:hypothetical protein
MEQPLEENKRGRGRGRGGEQRRGGARGQAESSPAAAAHPPSSSGESHRGGRGRGEGRGRGNTGHDEEGKGRGISKAQELFPIDYAEIEKIGNEINAAFRRIEEAHEKEEKLRESRKPLFDERNRIRATLQEGFDRGTLDSKKDRDVKIKSLSDEIANKSRLLREVREKLPFKDDKDPEFEKKVLKIYDDKTKELEKQMETQNLSGPEERRVLSKIKDVKKERNTLIPQYKQLKESQLKDIALKDHLISQNNEAREKINSIRSNEAALKAQMADISAKIDAIHEQIEKSRLHREEEKKKIDNLRKEKEAKNDALYQKVNYHYERQRAERERQKQIREERALLMEQKRKEWEEKKKQEEAARVPFEEELLVCDSVLSYLDAQVKISKPSAAAEKKKGQRQRQRGERALCHPPDVIESFEYLSLVLPLFPSDLEASISATKLKKESLLSLQKLELEKRANPHAFSAAEKEEESPVAEPTPASHIEPEAAPAEVHVSESHEEKKVEVVEEPVVEEPVAEEQAVEKEVVEEKIVESSSSSHAEASSSVSKVDDVQHEAVSSSVEEKPVDIPQSSSSSGHKASIGYSVSSLSVAFLVFTHITF